MDKGIGIYNIKYKMRVGYKYVTCIYIYMLAVQRIRYLGPPTNKYTQQIHTVKTLPHIAVLHGLNYPRPQTTLKFKRIGYKNNIYNSYDKQIHMRDMGIKLLSWWPTHTVQKLQSYNHSPKLNAIKTHPSCTQHLYQETPLIAPTKWPSIVCRFQSLAY